MSGRGRRLRLRRGVGGSKVRSPVAVRLEIRQEVGRR
jgi:hypothetical protein